MKITLISVAVVACLVWQLQDVDGNHVSSLGRIISEPAKVVSRSLQPRQNPASEFNALSVASSNCTQQQIDNIFEGYPSDCDNALREPFALTVAATYSAHSVYPDVTELLYNSTLNVVQKTLLKCFFIFVPPTPITIGATMFLQL